MEGKNFIPVINRREISKVFIENVILIEQELRKVVIYTDTEDEQYSQYGKIDEVEAFLDDRFFRCHHSCLINMKKIVKMREQTIFFENGRKIVVGREKFHAAKQRFAGYLMQEASSKKLLAHSVGL